jgi:hypothetical protein
MSRPDADLPSREPLSEQDLLVAGLLGRYIERREHGHAPQAQDLLAVAAEYGDTAVCTLRILLACYDAMRASEPGRRSAGRPAPGASHALS